MNQRWISAFGMCAMAVLTMLASSGCLHCPDADEVREFVLAHRTELAQIREWWAEDSQKGLFFVDMPAYGGPEARERISEERVRAYRSLMKQLDIGGIHGTPEYVAVDLTWGMATPNVGWRCGAVWFFDEAKAPKEMPWRTYSEQDCDVVDIGVERWKAYDCDWPGNYARRKRR